MTQCNCGNPIDHVKLTETYSALYYDTMCMQEHESEALGDWCHTTGNEAAHDALNNALETPGEYFMCLECTQEYVTPDYLLSYFQMRQEQLTSIISDYQVQLGFINSAYNAL